MTPTPVGMRCPECASQKTKVRTARTLTSEPRVTYVLIALNLIAFFGSFAAAGGGLVGGGSGASLLDRGALWGPAVHDGEWWRLVTGGFLHAGLIHILFNMYLLYILGTMLEPAIGRARFLALYFTSLLGGSFGALLVSPDALTVGASGAVFGLMGGAVLIMRARGFDPMSSGIPALIALNLLITFVFPGISIGGHLGGLAAGLVAAYVLVSLGDRLRSIAVPVAACAGMSLVLAVGAIAIA